MHDEYSRLALLVNHFSFINGIIYIFLEEDHHAEKVRTAFWPPYQTLSERGDPGLCPSFCDALPR